MRVQRVPEPPSTRRRQRGRVSPGCCAGASLRLTNCSTTWSKSHSRPLNDSTHGLRPTEPAPVARRVGRELGPRCRNGCAQAPSRAWRRSGRAPPPAPSLGFTDPLWTGDRRRQCRRQRLVVARTDHARRVAVRRLRQADRHRSVRRLHRRPGDQQPRREACHGRRVTTGGGQDHMPRLSGVPAGKRRTRMPEHIVRGPSNSRFVRSSVGHLKIHSAAYHRLPVGLSRPFVNLCLSPNPPIEA